MPGGKLEFGESFEEGAKREVQEETGVKINGVRVICVNNDKNAFAHFITIGLYSDEFEGEPKVMEPDEIVKWQWFNLDDLPTPLYFPSAKVIENYKKNAFYLPRELRGYESQGIILAADVDGRPVLLHPEE